MKWHDEYLRAGADGTNTFLFVGSIGDGFPLEADSGGLGARHPDSLDPWAEAVLARTDPKTLAWIYDVARGFRFRNADDETAFRRLLFGPAPTPTAPPATAGGTRTRRSDPIEQARQQLVNNALLPTADAGAAIAAMLEVFERTASASADSRPCLAILPDVDAWLGPPIGGPDRGSGRLALSIIRFAASDAFRRAGHRLLLGAISAHAVDERLCRPDSPIKLIRAAKPDETERRTFVADVVGFRKKIEGWRDERRTALERMKKEELAQLRNELRAAKKELADFDSDEAKRFAACLRAADEKTRRRYESLSKEKGELERKLKNHVPRERPMSADVWRRLREGDLVVLVSGSGNRETRDERKVMHTSSYDRVVLAKRDKDGRYRREERRSDGYYVLTYQYYWENGELMRCVNDGYDSSDGGPAPVPKNLKRIVRVPAGDLKPAQRLREVERSLSDLSERLRKDAQKGRAALSKRLQAAEKRLERPTTPEIEAVERDCADLEARLKNGGIEEFRLKGFSPDEFAKLTQGFGYRDIAAVLRVMRTSGAVSRQDLLKTRQDLLRRAYGDLLEIVEPAYGFEGVAGLDHVKRFFSAVREAIRRGDVRSVPMGCLLMGPPGTGKTAVAEAFARECGFLFVKMKNVRNMFVGESERRQEAALQALRDLAPAVVLRDEVDEEDSGRDSYQGDSGVSARLRRMWMELLSDPKIRGRIFVISCTNRPDRLDAALKRSGRTDERIPLLMPDRATREALFAVMVGRYGFPCSVGKFGAQAGLTEGFSGADIEVVVRRAWEFAAGEGKKTIDDRAIKGAIEDFIPSASQAMIAEMTLHALRETSSKRHLPADAKAVEAWAKRELARSAQ